MQLHKNSVVVSFDKASGYLDVADMYSVVVAVHRPRSAGGNGGT